MNLALRSHPKLLVAAVVILLAVVAAVVATRIVQTNAKAPGTSVICDSSNQCGSTGSTGAAGGETQEQMCYKTDSYGGTVPPGGPCVMWGYVISWPSSYTSDPTGYLKAHLASSPKPMSCESGSVPKSYVSGKLIYTRLGKFACL